MAVKTCNLPLSVKSQRASLMQQRLDRLPLDRHQQLTAWAPKVVWSGSGSGCEMAVHTHKQGAMPPLRSRYSLCWERISSFPHLQLRFIFEVRKISRKVARSEMALFVCRLLWLKGLETIQGKIRDGGTSPVPPKESSSLGLPAPYPKWSLALVALRHSARLCKTTVLSTLPSCSYALISLSANFVGLYTGRLPTVTVFP